MHKYRVIVENATAIYHNEEWKQSMDIEKRSNKNFLQIPFNILRYEE